jgi:hypothetical protein
LTGADPIDELSGFFDDRDTQITVSAGAVHRSPSPKLAVPPADAPAATAVYAKGDESTLTSAPGDDTILPSMGRAVDTHTAANALG